MCEKDVGIVTGVCEETFDINGKNSSNKAKYLKFQCQNPKLQEMANFRDYLKDFRL